MFLVLSSLVWILQEIAGPEDLILVNYPIFRKITRILSVRQNTLIPVQEWRDSMPSSPCVLFSWALICCFRFAFFAQVKARLG